MTNKKKRLQDMTELEYTAHLLRLQKDGVITKLETLQRFSEWKKWKDELQKKAEAGKR
ncbi:MAG: hypothetical protein ACXAD7_17850 [Candidatus Kariarchaeaceae archaeon]|jgi:hypothetical protein